MSPNDPDRYCAKCGIDWLGDPIPEDSLHHFNSPWFFMGVSPDDDGYDLGKLFDNFKSAIKDGKFKDNPEFNTHFDRRIGIYDIDKDRTIAYQCPKCEWEARK